jgi:hypothetical protein
VGLRRSRERHREQRVAVPPKSDSYSLRDYSSASAPDSDLPSMAAIRAPAEGRDEKPNASDDHGGERDVQLVQARNLRPSPDVGTDADYQLTPSC